MLTSLISMKAVSGLTDLIVGGVSAHITDFNEVGVMTCITISMWVVSVFTSLISMRAVSRPMPSILMMVASRLTSC